jgi:hypothetical protein
VVCMGKENSILLGAQDVLSGTPSCKLDIIVKLILEIVDIRIPLPQESF